MAQGPRKKSSGAIDGSPARVIYLRGGLCYPCQSFENLPTGVRSGRVPADQMSNLWQPLNQPGSLLMGKRYADGYHLAYTDQEQQCFRR